VATTTRAALTTIYFLLPAGQVSRWHRVTSDEVWHYYEGAPLELVMADAAMTRLTRRVLGPVGDGMAPVATVPASEWQAARSTGAYTLTGCTVGPGFEFDDFEMLVTGDPRLEALTECDPVAAAFV
jgi:predicted cupin superfamily sugar epimerase